MGLGLAGSKVRLFASCERSYLHGMDDTWSLPQDWIDALDRAEADAATGRILDGARLHHGLEASIERMRHGPSPSHRWRLG